MEVCACACAPRRQVVAAKMRKEALIRSIRILPQVVEGVPAIRSILLCGRVSSMRSQACFQRHAILPGEGHGKLPTSMRRRRCSTISTHVELLGTAMVPRGQLSGRTSWGGESGGTRLARELRRATEDQ